MRQEFEEVLQMYNLLDYKKIIIDNSQPCVKLAPESKAEDLIPLGKSKLGGSPDLPENFNIDNISENLSFIAQLNCKDIFSVDQTGSFPDNGFLYFFYDVSQHVTGIKLSEKPFWKVLYFNEDCRNLQRLKISKDDNDIFSSAQLKEIKEISFPDIEDERLLEFNWPEEVQDSYLDFIEFHFTEAEINHQVLGYPKTIQLEVFTEVLPLIQEDKKDINIKFEDLILLFQISTDESESDMVWGDNGIIYFIMTKNDLEERNFNSIWLSLQSN